jgi:hypothetical protein
MLFNVLLANPRLVRGQILHGWLIGCERLPVYVGGLLDSRRFLNSAIKRNLGAVESKSARAISRYTLVADNTLRVGIGAASNPTEGRTAFTVTLGDLETFSKQWSFTLLESLIMTRRKFAVFVLVSLLQTNFGRAAIQKLRTTNARRESIGSVRHEKN